MNIYIILALIVFFIFIGLILIFVNRTTKNEHEHVESKYSPIIIDKNEIVELVQKEVELDHEQTFTLAEIFQYGKHGQSINLQQSVDLYISSFEKSINNSHKAKCCMALGHIFRNGLENILPPDALNALKYFIMAFSYGNGDAIFDIIEIYEHGLHPFFLPEKITTSKILNLIIYDKPEKFSHEMIIIAKEKQKNLISKISYVDIDKTRQDNRAYKDLPSDITIKLETIISQFPDKFEIVNTTFTKTSRVQAHIIDNNEDFQETLWNDLIEQNNRDRGNTILDILPEQVIVNDSQNVHSSSLNNSAKKTIEIIENSSTISKSFNNNVNMFLNSIPKTDEISLEKVSRVLESLNDNKHSKFDKSEKDVFNIIWSRINDPVNLSVRTSLIQSLADNISSAIEHSFIVCSTGKIMRMIGSLDAIDKEAVLNLKPEWAIKEEIGNNAAIIRNEILEHASNKEREMYNEGGMNDLAKQMSEKLKSKCKKDYDGILTDGNLDIIIQPYLDSF